jgi:hypothetical protein
MKGRSFIVIKVVIIYPCSVNPSLEIQLTARRNRHVIKISDIPCVFQDMNHRIGKLIVVYDKQKTALVDDPSDLIDTRRLSPVTN